MFSMRFDLLPAKDTKYPTDYHRNWQEGQLHGVEIHQFKAMGAIEKCHNRGEYGINHISMTTIPEHRAEYSHHRNQIGYHHHKNEHPHGGFTVLRDGDIFRPKLGHQVCESMDCEAAHHDNP